ncbi:MAG: amidohydrolase family protein, partial [Clostridia bacterium]|nr:amidohydrolase family protein [Clostridia bacterium]
MINYLKDFGSCGDFSDKNWLTGRGWNQDYFTDVDRMPTRADLDSISTEIPIIIVRACGHCLVANSKAIEISGITLDTPIPDGGEIGRTESGELDGRFFDNAMGYIYDAVPVPDKEAVKNMIRTASQKLNSYGITGSHSDDYCVFSGLPWQTVNEAFHELIEAGELTVRVYEQSNFTSLETLKEFVEAGNVTGAGSDMFKIGPLKMLGDGALGARTAFLTKPYADDPSQCGLPVFNQQTMDEMITYAHANNMQVAVHAIGDGCLDMLLSAYEKAFANCPRNDHRSGVVHCQITRPDQLRKIADLDLHVYAQTIFLDYDIHIVKDRVGEELASTSYSWKTLMNKGVTVSNGSDCPVEWPDCLRSMQCAVTRTTVRDNIGPYLPDEAFTVREAIDSYTKVSAFASFEENVKGQIKPGMLADFVVLDKNLFEVDKFDISNVKVIATYLGAKKVY